MPASGVTVELFGVPRVLAGRRSLDVAGRTLADVTAGLAEACPALVGPVIDGESGWLREGYTFVVDERFVSDRSTRVDARSGVLLVSSVAGGAGVGHRGPARRSAPPGACRRAAGPRG